MDGRMQALTLARQCFEFDVGAFLLYDFKRLEFLRFTRAKSFDTFCPVGPYIETELNPEDVAVITRVNGQIKQSASTSAMAFSVKFLIKYISHAMTLFPGDLIATGTPAGVSKLHAGDMVEVEIEGIGVLRNPVVAAD